MSDDPLLSEDEDLGYGSFNYLYSKKPIEMVSSEDDLKRMAEQLSRMDLEDAAQETNQVLILIGQLLGRLETHVAQLSPVWKVIEEHHEGRASAKSVQDAIKQYRSK